MGRIWGSVATDTVATLQYETMQTATHYTARHLTIITGQILRQQVTVILICYRQSCRGHTGPEVRTGDNEPRRNAPFSSFSSLNPCFSVLLVCSFFFYVPFAVFLSSYFLPLQITIFTLVLIILLISTFSNCSYYCLFFATSLIFHYHPSFTIFIFSEYFFIRITLPLFFPSDISATIFFPLFPFVHTFPYPSPLPLSSYHLLQAVPHQLHLCTIEHRRVWTTLWHEDSLSSPNPQYKSLHFCSNISSL